MKKILFSITMLLLAFVLKAQTYDEIKQSVLLGMFKKAKEDVDKRMTNAKFAAKAEAYILKATIYSTLASDSAAQKTGEGAALLAEAETAFKKYKEMEPKLELLQDPAYKNAAINIYSNFFSAGYKLYDEKKFAESFETFKKVNEYSDLLTQQKILNTPLDTNVVILSAITAESSGNKDEAARYYGRLADAKLKGASYESIYRFLVTHYFTKNDMANFEKYKDIGKELYPNSEFFTYDKTDFAVGLDNSFDKKMKSLEDVLAKDPSNYKANLSLGQLIYDTLNPKIDHHCRQMQLSWKKEWWMLLIKPVNQNRMRRCLISLSVTIL
jgi:hypothetical protein